MVGFFASWQRGAISCSLLTGACAVLTPNPAQADTVHADAAPRFGDVTFVTNWSLPRQAQPVGPLPEPTFVRPLAIDALSQDKGAAVATPNEAAPTSPSPDAKRTEPARAPAPQLAVEDRAARAFTRGDRYRLNRTPAQIKGLEIAFHVLNAADATSTVVCLRRDDCQEENPIYGKRPKAIMVIGAKALTSGVHYWVMRTLLPEHEGTAKAFGWLSLAIQGSVVGLNMRQLF